LRSGVNWLIIFSTAALVKRFTQETGSDWVNSLCSFNAEHNMYIAAITGAEVIAALTRRQHGNSSEDVLLAEAIQQFRNEFNFRYRIIETKLDIIHMAMFMAEKHALRGYDAVQLAVAYVLNFEPQVLHSPLTLISADNELNIAARKENLLVENPNDHP
jgi:predicted nucleic acid-binding protein